MPYWSALSVATFASYRIRELFGEGEIWNTVKPITGEYSEYSRLRISFVDCLPNVDCCENTVRNAKKANLEDIVRELQLEYISQVPNLRLSTTRDKGNTQDDATYSRKVKSIGPHETGNTIRYVRPSLIDGTVTKYLSAFTKKAPVKR